MLNNFIYAQTKELFLNALDNNQILDEAIVFIEDTKEIWNHGHYFGGIQNLSEFVTDEQWQSVVNQINSINTSLNTKATKDELTNYATIGSIPTNVSQLTNDKSYLTKTDTDQLYATTTQHTNLSNTVGQLNTTVAAKLSSEDAEKTYATKSELDNKQDSITDLETIRSGAALGATAVQPSELNDINTSISDINTTLALKLDSASAESIYAKIENIPTNNAELANGAGYITIEDIDNKYAEKALETTVSGLNTTVNNLSGTVSTNTENIGKVSGRVETIENYFNGVNDVDNALNKWHEITNFLNGITESDNLTSMLANKADKSALDAIDTTVKTISGWGNHADVGYQSAIDDLDTIRTNASDGAIAHGWGNHASAGYATTGNLNALSTTVNAIAAHFSTGKFSIDGYVSEGMSNTTNINAIPITAGSCRCTISADGTFGLANTTVEAGRTIHILVCNSSSTPRTIALPTTGSYRSFSGSSLVVPANGFAEISVFSDGLIKFIRAGY